MYILYPLLVCIVGKLVLNELGLDVEVYYASEINTDAMLVASYHHRVTHVGDAAKLTRAQVYLLRMQMTR